MSFVHSFALAKKQQASKETSSSGGQYEGSRSLGASADLKKPGYRGKRSGCRTGISKIPSNVAERKDEPGNVTYLFADLVVLPSLASFKEAWRDILDRYTSNRNNYQTDRNRLSVLLLRVHFSNAG